MYVSSRYALLLSASEASVLTAKLRNRFFGRVFLGGFVVHFWKRHVRLQPPHSEFTPVSRKFFCHLVILLASFVAQLKEKCLHSLHRRIIFFFSYSGLKTKLAMLSALAGHFCRVYTSIVQQIHTVQIFYADIYFEILDCWGSTRFQELR